MSVDQWGPPNHAAHTAGHVQHESEPLRAPDRSTPRSTVAQHVLLRDQLRPDPLREFIRTVEQLLGREWRVEVWEDPFRFKLGMQARHGCGFKISETFDLDHRGPVSEKVRDLSKALLAKERRHSCEAIAAKRS